MVRSGSARSIGQPALPAAIPGDASVARDELLRCLSTRSFVPYRSFAKANYKLIAVDARAVPRHDRLTGQRKPWQDASATRRVAHNVI